MRFQVPQFIEHEAKVIGPLTFKQFVYLGVPGAIGFFLYFLTPFPVFISITIPLGAFGFLLGFIKMGGRSLPGLLSSFVKFIFEPKRYIWRKGKAPAQTPQARYVSAAPEESYGKAKIQLVQKSRVRDLAIRVDTAK
ncbi:MAG: PrgI family protein [Candidatus Wildermuthbacteria bacterium]|nr:PrgI family protein [Candidatus Wildermuthbacteria bacterium]